MPMTADQARDRAKLITPRLLEDVASAICSHAIMDECNNIVSDALGGIGTPQTTTYYVIQNSLALKVAMDVARMFDVSERGRFEVYEQDKASVQVLAALLQRDGVKDLLQAEVKDFWTELNERAQMEVVAAEIDGAKSEDYLRNFDDVDLAVKGFQEALETFLTHVSVLSDDASEESKALKRIREFRVSRLAHNLFENSTGARPTYNDLSLLLALAQKAARAALLAVDGKDHDFEKVEQIAREDARAYALAILSALQATAPQR